jgi:hypothetical protein
VAVLDEPLITGRFAAGGFRRRPEPWNSTETSGGRTYRKLVFAPPAGARDVLMIAAERWDARTGWSGDRLP